MTKLADELGNEIKGLIGLGSFDENGYPVIWLFYNSDFVTSFNLITQDTSAVITNQDIKNLFFVGYNPYLPIDITNKIIDIENLVSVVFLCIDIDSFEPYDNLPYIIDKNSSNENKIILLTSNYNIEFYEKIEPYLYHHYIYTNGNIRPASATDRRIVSQKIAVNPYDEYSIIIYNSYHNFLRFNIYENGIRKVSPSINNSYSVGEEEVDTVFISVSDYVSDIDEKNTYELQITFTENPANIKNVNCILIEKNVQDWQNRAGFISKLRKAHNINLRRR